MFWWGPWDTRMSFEAERLVELTEQKEQTSASIYYYCFWPLTHIKELEVRKWEDRGREEEGFLEQVAGVLSPTGASPLSQALWHGLQWNPTTPIQLVMYALQLEWTDVYMVDWRLSPKSKREWWADWLLWWWKGKREYCSVGIGLHA